MAKCNSAWLLRKRPLRSQTGVDTETFHAVVKNLRSHWRERVVDPDLLYSIGVYDFVVGHPHPLPVSYASRLVQKSRSITG